jgi:hypothetical protein
MLREHKNVNDSFVTNATIKTSVLKDCRILNQVAFQKPPKGEGDVMWISMRDLRPTLIWKDEKWIVPLNKNDLPPMGVFEGRASSASFLKLEDRWPLNNKGER